MPALEVELLACGLEISAGLILLGMLTTIGAGEGIRTPMPFWGRGF
jgi:hypothetical protein